MRHKYAFRQNRIFYGNPFHYQKTIFIVIYIVKTLWNKLCKYLDHSKILSSDNYFMYYNV